MSSPIVPLDQKTMCSRSPSWLSRDDRHVQRDTTARNAMNSAVAARKDRRITGSRGSLVRALGGAGQPHESRGGEPRAAGIIVVVSLDASTFAEVLPRGDDGSLRIGRRFEHPVGKGGSLRNTIVARAKGPRQVST